MKGVQYTLRSVPATVDRALRRKARGQGRSLNVVAVEALARGLEIEASEPVITDLDDLAGSWVEDLAFDEAMVDFSRIESAEGT